MMKYLVTGAAGFIGFYVSQRLCEMGYDVVGIDNLNSYYDPRLKIARLEKLNLHRNFQFKKIDLSDSLEIKNLFRGGMFNRVIHLGAQAGVRYSLENPMAYVDSNLIGMMNVLEGCRDTNVEHLVYASSSSVYGMNKKIPYSTKDSVDHPVSLYAATKKSNELMAHSYSHLYKIPTTGLRFFTVNGPWGRPDMAAWKFTESILKGESIDVYNNGFLKRDFTDINDVLEGIILIQNVIPEGKNISEIDTSCSTAPYKIYNIGNNNPIDLIDFISAIESACGKKAIKNHLPMQAGDVYMTCADVDDLMNAVKFKPNTSIYKTMDNFVKWFIEYNKL